MLDTEYLAKIEALRQEYEPRILAILNRVKGAFLNAGWHVMCEPFYMDGDEHSWHVAMVPSPGSFDGCVDVAFEINEQWCSDGEGAGVTFRVEAQGQGGRLIGGLAPGNYTENCWLSLDDKDAIEKRFCILEGADEYEIVDLAEKK